MANSLSGHPLLGDKIVRLTYLDEGGTSAREPAAVVAGVIVHGDSQLALVEERLQALATEFIPLEDRRGFVFHATDIWSGGRYFKDRERWPLNKRIAILEALADIPVKFELPVTVGTMQKDQVREVLGPHERSDKVVDVVSHACAFCNATQRVERYFRDNFPNEMTIIIAEDRQAVRTHVETRAKRASSENRRYASGTNAGVCRPAVQTHKGYCTFRRQSGIGVASGCRHLRVLGARGRERAN